MTNRKVTDMATNVEVKPGEPSFGHHAIDNMLMDRLQTPLTPPDPPDLVKALEALLVGRVRDGLPISREEVELLRFLDAKQLGHQPSCYSRGGN